MIQNLIMAGILIEDRNNIATKVQEILTKYSEFIFCRTGVSDLTNYCRLGEGVVQVDGVISLIIRSGEEKVQDLANELGKIPGVIFKYMVLSQ